MDGQDIIVVAGFMCLLFIFFTGLIHMLAVEADDIRREVEKLQDEVRLLKRKY